MNKNLMDIMIFLDQLDDFSYLIGAILLTLFIFILDWMTKEAKR